MQERGWSLKWSEEASKQLRKLDKSVARRIVDYLKTVATQDNPYAQAKAMRHGYSGYWCYRIGDYRVICSLEDNELVICVVELGHRSKVYG